MWAEAGRAGGRTVSKLANTSTERDLSDSHSCSRCVGDARRYPGSNSDRNSGDYPGRAEVLSRHNRTFSNLFPLGGQLRWSAKV